MLRNRTVSFICRDVWLRVERTDTALTSACLPGGILTVPVGHGEGNYFADKEVLDRIEGEGQVLFRYVSPPQLGGVLDDRFNFNGSARSIAGIMNERGNVFGVMPHPERNSETVLGNAQGLVIFQSLLLWHGKAVA